MQHDPERNAEISGSFTQQSAQDLGNILSYGALPLSFQEQSVTTVTAALGGDQLQAGLIAGAIGLALVIIYLVAYYRGLAGSRSSASLSPRSSRM